MLCEILASVVLYFIPCDAYRQPHPEDLVANAFFQVTILLFSMQVSILSSMLLLLHIVAFYKRGRGVPLFWQTFFSYEGIPSIELQKLQFSAKSIIATRLISIVSKPISIVVVVVVFVVVQKSQVQKNLGPKILDVKKELG